MDYTFDEEKFKRTFNVDESKDVNERRLTHVQEMGYKLYPNKAGTKATAVIDMRDVIGGFFRYALKIGKKQIKHDELCQEFYDCLDVKEEDKESIFEVISNLFFRNGYFYTENIGLYPYQTVDNKEADELSFFLYCVLGDSNEISQIIKQGNLEDFNVLERLVFEYVNNLNNNDTSDEEPYIPIYTGMKDVFIEDLKFLLSSNMTSIDDFASLFSLYYFQYYVQTALILDSFFTENPQRSVELYYALDWERVSKNRKCCTDGWEKVKNNISHSFAHKTTLGILNNNKQNKKMNYIDFYNESKKSDKDDELLAQEVLKAEKTYTSYLGDFPGFANIPKSPSINKTEEAIKHLFECAEQQFLGTKRSRARDSFNNKFIFFCKERWIKDRKKSGLVLNLTEQDIIFLTKLSIRNNEKIRLNEMFKEYQKRGVYLDSTSKQTLQEFFSKLNIIDKKSDSGDAQYVRRIL